MFAYLMLVVINIPKSKAS